MDQYLQLCQKILDSGKEQKDRTKTGTKSIFGHQMVFDLSNSFPLLTTKKVNFAAIAHELLWFISGDTNIKYLVDNNVNIWNEWPYLKFTKSDDFQNETLIQFKNKIQMDEVFAKKYGDLGPVYGKQWRNFNGIDQLKKLQEQLIEDPFSRRHIISAWNPAEIDSMILPPCHTLIQFYVNNDKELSAHLYQRSGDVFLGIPFNIASYSLMVYLLAQVCGYKPGNFIHTIGDAHIYNNHIEQIKTQLQRKPKKLPQVKVNSKIKSIFDFTFNDITLIAYDYHPFIKAPVAV